MRLYLSGPMTGLPDYGYPIFHAAAERLRALGHEVENPAEHFKGRQDLPRKVYLKRDIGEVLKAEAVAVLPGWQGSKGACLEVAVAREIGLPILDAATLEPWAESVCEEAQRIIHGPRRTDYGHPLDNHTRTAALWAAYLGVAITPEQVCFLNVLQKVARSQQAITRDTLTDICGFAGNIELVQNERARRSA